VVYPLQADLRIVRRSTIERKQMSTKTTFKRIALVAVAALGFGVLSVVPSQAVVSGLIVTTTNGNFAADAKTGESATAASIKVQFLGQATSDTVSVTIVPAAALPSGAAIAAAGLWFTDSTTSTGTAPTVDTAAALTSNTAGPIVQRGEIMPGSYFRVIAPLGTANGSYSVTMKYALGDTATAGNTIVAGTYSFNAIVKSEQAAGAKTDVYPFSITVAAAAVPAKAVPSATAATAYLQSGASGWNFGASTLTDSVTTGSLLVGTTIGAIKLTNLSSALATANDTVTVTMTGSGYLTTTGVSAGNVTGRSFVIKDVASLTANILADGTSGTGTITMKTEAGASFVKTVTFFDTKPSKAVATVAKAYIKAGTGSVDKVFSVVVTDAAGTAVTTGVTVSAAPTDATTTVGGAATCGAYNATDKVYYCAVAGLSTTKFGPVAYTIKATEVAAPGTVVSTSATVTFADSVATKAVLAGPASALPGAVAEYTLTLTEKNGYPVADQLYGVGSGAGGLLIATVVATGWTTAPFAATDSFTAKSGVITSKGTMPLAGTATGTWTLVGDGIQTLAADAIDKTIGKTTLTVSTEVANPAADAATQAAEEAAAAAQDATDAALDATTAAEAAGALAQEAVDAVAELSAQVTTLIAALKDQITKLTNLVVKIQKKVKA
jgi:hypothetical protein